MNVAESMEAGQAGEKRKNLRRIIDTSTFSAHSQHVGTIALTELLGSPVLEASGAHCGRVREVALTPAEDRARVSTLIVRTKNGDKLLPFTAVASLNGGV